MQKIIFLALALTISASASAQTPTCNPVMPNAACGEGAKFKKPKSVKILSYCIGASGCSPACATCISGSCYCSTCCVAKPQ